MAQLVRAVQIKLQRKPLCVKKRTASCSPDCRPQDSVVDAGAKITLTQIDEFLLQTAVDFIRHPLRLQDQI
jgi:hypothetical protein